MPLSKKILYSLASVGLFSTQLLSTVPMTKAESVIKHNDNTLNNKAIVVEGTNVTVKPSYTNNNITLRNIEELPVKNNEIITSSLSLETANSNKNEITITKKSNIRMILTGKFKLSNTEDLSNIVLFTPLTNEFFQSANDNSSINLKIDIPKNQVTTEIQRELETASPSVWNSSSDTTDITSLGKIKNQNGIISWGINNPNIAKLLKNLDYRSTLNATFTPTNETAISTKINSYLVLNSEIAKSEDQIITYKSQNNNDNSLNNSNDNSDQSVSTNKPINSNNSDELNTARKNAYRIVEKNKNLTDEQKNAFESLIDKSVTIDQINAISALATSIINNSNSSNTEKENISKDKLTFTKQAYQNEIKLLSNLNDRQKVLYSMLIDTSDSTSNMDKILEVAKMQDSEQLGLNSNKLNKQNENNTNTNLIDNNNNKDKPNSNNNLSNNSNNSSSTEQNTDPNNKAVRQNFSDTKYNNSSDPNTNKTKDTINSNKDIDKDKDKDTTTFSNKSSNSKGASNSNDFNKVLAQENGNGYEKIAQTGIKQETFLNWLSNLFK